MTIWMKDRKVDVYNNGTTVKMFVTDQALNVTNLEFSTEEASYLSMAIETVLGRSKPLEPKEKVRAP